MGRLDTKGGPNIFLHDFLRVHGESLIRIEGDEDVGCVGVDFVLHVAPFDVVKHGAFIKKHKAAVIILVRGAIFLRGVNRFILCLF